nr:hypothetical protein [uncultured Draconibacterium sp.]
MKLLPHYFKRIGLALFFAGFVTGAFTINARKAFVEGWNAGADSANKIIESNIDKGLSEEVGHIADFASILGLLIYVLAKQKREDELMQKLRYQSAFIVMVITLAIILLIYGFKSDFSINPSVLLSLQMIGYLIIRAIKRNLIDSGSFEEQTVFENTIEE